MTDTRLEFAFPPREISPNARVHWRRKAKVVAAYREEVGFIALASAPSAYRDDYWPLKPPVRAAVTFVVPTRHKRDEDNLLAMLKPAWDGLTDAGVLEGDDSERFRIERTEIVTCGYAPPLEMPKVIVVLRSL